MRLTNVTQMALPSGRVRSYGLRVTDRAGDDLPISFDQKRHVGGGDRSGSWMSIAFRLDRPLRADDLAIAWHAVIDRHGTLRTAFSETDRGLRLGRIDVDGGAWEDHPGAPGALTRDVARDVFDATCRPFARPSYRLLLVEPEPDAADPRPAVMIGADHAHVDMWSLLVLVRDLVVCLEDVRDGRRPGVGLPAADAFVEHTAVLDAGPSAPIDVTGRWAEILDAEGGLMPRFPLPLGDLSRKTHAAVAVHDVLDEVEMAAFAERAKHLGVGAAALAMSHLAAATRDVADAPLRAVFPVHSRYESRWHDSVGWFITNSVLECDDAEPATAAVALREAMRLGSHPLGPILEPYGGMPVAPGMFAVSWLDTRRLPVTLDPPMEIQYVSSVIESDDVMVWFIVNASGLHLRYRCPDTPEARANVGLWVDAVSVGLRSAATAPLPAPSG